VLARLFRRLLLETLAAEQAAGGIASVGDAEGPRPLSLIGNFRAGSAKTALSKMLTALVDPNAAPFHAPPREERELMIAANNGYLPAFDNLSGLPRAA